MKYGGSELEWESKVLAVRPWVSHFTSKPPFPHQRGRFINIDLNHFQLVYHKNFILLKLLGSSQGCCED